MLESHLTASIARLALALLLLGGLVAVTAAQDWRRRWWRIRKVVMVVCKQINNNILNYNISSPSAIVREPLKKEPVPQGTHKYPCEYHQVPTLGTRYM